MSGRRALLRAAEVATVLGIVAVLVTVSSPAVLLATCLPGALVLAVLCYLDARTGRG